MSGRWGDRPLGRGGWRVLQPEASSVLPTVRLRSRAAERVTGAIRPKPSYSGSRNQLPITVTILLSAIVRVDSPPGSFFSVLLAIRPAPVLVPPYLRNFFAMWLPLLPPARLASLFLLQANTGWSAAVQIGKGSRRSADKPSGTLRLERVCHDQWNDNAEADVLPWNWTLSSLAPTPREK
jgi:hypothetical protein